MPIVPMKDMLAEARNARYGVAAFNVLDDLSTRAVIDAAEEVRSPVIVQTSVKTVKSIGAPLLYEIFRSRAETSTVPVTLHLDHCPDRAVITECLANGWNAVLFDASSYALEDARTQAREVVEEAKATNATVELEIENIKGVEDDIGTEDEGRRYALDVVAKFIEDTGPDCFAPAVGTAHGMYTKRPELDPQRVTDLVALTGIPMVLHGGSGLTADDFADLVARGCAKVNISTALKESYMRSSLDFLRSAEEANKWDPPSLFRHVHKAIVGTVTEHLTMLGSQDRAGERA